MPFPRMMVMDQGIQRPEQFGDVVPSCEPFPASVTTVTYAVTAATLLAAFQNRAPAGNSADTLPTAAALIAAASTPVANNTTWRQKVVNTGAGIITVTAPANAGVTVALPTINAGSVKEFLMTVTNGTPATSIINVSSTNASPTVTGLTQAQTDAISVGMVVTNAILNLQGQTVIGIVPGVSVTFSGNANATSTGNTINLSPTYTVQGVGQGLV